MKLLGALLVIAALALAGLAAPGTAGAALLCPENEEACTDPLPAGTELKLATNISPTEGSKFVTNLGTIVCDSSLAGKTTEEGSESENVAAELSSLTFTSCTISGNSCTVTAVNLPYAASIEWTTGTNGALTASSSGKGNPGATVVCGEIINCNFSAVTPKLTLTGGTPAVLSASSIALTRTGSKCPTTATWTAAYRASLPKEGKFFVARKAWIEFAPSKQPVEITVGTTKAITVKNTRGFAVNVTENGPLALPFVLEPPANGTTCGATPFVLGALGTCIDVIGVPAGSGVGVLGNLRVKFQVPVEVAHFRNLQLKTK